MQLTEVSVFGVRSAVTVFRHRESPLRFVLFPMIHVAKPLFYRQVTERLARCRLIVAEAYDGPSSTGLAYATAMRLTRQNLGSPLVHQNIDYEALGVPTVWPDELPLTGRHTRIPLWGWVDLVAMVPYLTVTMAVGGRDWVLRRNYEISDDSRPRISRSARINRLLVEERDRSLVATLAGIHAERHGQAIDVGVVYGAGHMPMVVRALVAELGYRPERGGEWLVAIDF